MHVVGQLGSRRRHSQRLIVSALVLLALAGTSLATQGTASSSVNRASAEREQPSQRLTKAFREWPNLDPRLASLVRHERQVSMRLIHARTSGLQFRRGRVRVEVVAANLPAALSGIRRLGGSVQTSWHRYVAALMPPASLGRLSRLASVRFVRAPELAVRQAVPGEEVGASFASALQAKGITGKGTKVAIIDGGFTGLADRQASGDVPA